jgi:hypothetical protein
MTQTEINKRVAIFLLEGRFEKPIIYKMKEMK